MPTEAELLSLAKAFRRQSVRFAQRTHGPAWDQSYKAFRSEFIASSKYKSDDYAHRSKIFRPKTKIAVTKDLAGAAQTLFSTVDMVSVDPGDETDPKQIANAEMIKELMKYRLDRTRGKKSSIPWFLTSMGARQDCNIAGICVSKQHWLYQERKKITIENVRDPMTGEVKPQRVEKMVRIKDRPEIALIPPEHAMLDQAAHWMDVVNSGAGFAVKYPMHVQDVKDMMQDPRTKWRGFDEGEDPDGSKLRGAFSAARAEEFETASSTRRAREGGDDRLSNQDAEVSELDVVWAIEWFIRFKDEDWCFWTLGTEHMLSVPVPTEEAYPWSGGERPYHIGIGNLEAHRIVPQSPVQTWQPLQMEINDVTNLRLDNLKQVIQPVAMVKRGKKIDTDSLKRRYPVLYVDNPKEDVVWDRPPEAAGAAFAETSRLDTDFDDLAGVFSGGSVASNRQIGETLGGMKMMAGSSNAVTEFYTRLWVETWVEPVLASLAKLEAYYEDDEKIIAICKKRAPSMVHFGDDALTDEFLSQEVLIRVSAGVGSHDPMQKSAKLQQALEQCALVFKGSKRFQSGELQIKEEALINEIMGNAGQRDGFDRFFEVVQVAPQGAPPNPDADPAVLADAKAERDSKENIAKLKAKTDITKTLIGARADQRDQHREHKTQGKHKFVDVLMQAASQDMESQHREADREVIKNKPAPKAAA